MDREAFERRVVQGPGTRLIFWMGLGFLRDGRCSSVAFAAPSVTLHVAVRVFEG
jgi:hypothetical protein